MEELVSETQNTSCVSTLHQLIGSRFSPNRELVDQLRRHGALPSKQQKQRHNLGEVGSVGEATGLYRMSTDLRMLQSHKENKAFEREFQCDFNGLMISVRSWFFGCRVDPRRL